MDVTRIFIAVALFFCGMILSIMGIIAGKRANGEPVDWFRLGRSAGLTAAGAVAAASIWPVSGWEWASGDVVPVIGTGFGLNAGLSKGLQVIFPKRTV